jgi:hypothetical protein
VLLSPSLHHGNADASIVNKSEQKHQEYEVTTIVDPSGWRLEGVEGLEGDAICHMNNSPFPYGDSNNNVPSFQWYGINESSKIVSIYLLYVSTITPPHNP